MARAWLETGMVMAQFFRIADYRRSPARVHFERSELNRLLTLYSGGVAAGEWRDYAIDSGPGGAVFAVFRRTNERPVFTIAKLAPDHRGGGWLVRSGSRPLRRAASLEEVLGVFDRLRPVSPQASP